MRLEIFNIFATIAYSKLTEIRVRIGAVCQTKIFISFITASIYAFNSQGGGHNTPLSFPTMILNHSLYPHFTLL